ncbi:MAG TPA: hypothetical protein VF461_09775 [Gemmatimonadaceae bacterium]
MSCAENVIELPVLGIATRFETNDAEVARCVEEAFGMWRTLAVETAPVDASREAPLLVRVDVVEGDEGPLLPDGHAIVRYECPDAARVVVRTAASMAMSDPQQRRAVARVTSGLVADHMHFRTEILEAVTLALLSHFDRHPVHAAAVALNGRAVLLAAPSGTGKSTLAYHCHLDGLDLLGDDHVRVQLEPRVRVWGWPARVRLLAGAATSVSTPSSNAVKEVIHLQTGVTPARLLAEEMSVCCMSRDGGPAMLEPLDAAALARALDEQIAPGFDRFPARWPRVRDALAVRGGWRLNLSSDPREGVALVRRVLA